MSSEMQRLTFDRLVQCVSARRWICGGIVLAVAMCGIAIAYLSPKVYRADALLAPNREVAAELSGAAMLGSLGNIASLSGLLEPEQALTDEAIATLRSRAFLRKFIEDESLLPILYQKKWDPETKNWKAGIKKVPTVSRAWKKFRDDVLRIEEVRGTGLYIVSVEWGDPNLPAAWLGSLIKRLNQEMRAREMKEANDVLQFLRSQVEHTDAVEIRTSLFRLTESQLRRVAMANVRQDYAFRVLDPPVPSEVDQFVRPRRAILIGIFIVLGFAVALVAAVVSPKREPGV